MAELRVKGEYMREKTSKGVRTELLDARDPERDDDDAVQALLAASGVSYMHDNSEVVGSAKIEEQLSKRAAMMDYEVDDSLGRNRLFEASQEVSPASSLHHVYNPPEDVQLRQFCQMAREFGFLNTTEFALAVEGWSQETRRDCLDVFYRRRAEKLQREGLLNNDLTSIVVAIEMGRLVFDNLKKVILYLMPVRAH